MLSRREMARLLAATGSLAAMPRARAAYWNGAANPFTLGVASGFPTHRSVVLWTRLAPEPLAPGGGMPPQDVPLRWELASDDRFRRIVRRGQVHAEAAWAHSARVEVDGLLPARDYWYRFVAPGYESPAGRTRTTPTPGAPLASLELVAACCQHYEQGRYAAWTHVAAAPPDVILHLGDYIYEGAANPRMARVHDGPACVTLEQYRSRYAQYRLDPALQAAHASAPWLLTWDDHEVANDYAGLEAPGEADPVAFLARRTAAYRAYYENQPLPPAAAPRGVELPILARRRLGDLATIHLLDQRQYRSPAAGTMLGAAQERWFDEGLGRDPARWTLIAQGTLFCHVDQLAGEGRQYSADNWNGYPGARERLLASVQRHQAANPVVLSGDLHAFVVGHVNAVPERLETPIVAAEFCVSSISSSPRPQPMLDGWRAGNENLLLAEGRQRGYLRMRLTHDAARADLMAIADVADPASPQRVMASYLLEAGSSRLQTG